MFDNKTMLLIVLGLVVFLLTRPSKNNAAKTDQTETEVTTETPIKPTESETVENFGNVDSKRVNTRYSSYPFLKEDCVCALFPFQILLKLDARSIPLIGMQKAYSFPQNHAVSIPFHSGHFHS